MSRNLTASCLHFRLAWILRTQLASWTETKSGATIRPSNLWCTWSRYVVIRLDLRNQDSVSREIQAKQKNRNFPIISAARCIREGQLVDVKSEAITRRANAREREREREEMRRIRRCDGWKNSSLIVAWLCEKRIADNGIQIVRYVFTGIFSTRAFQLDDGLLAATNSLLSNSDSFRDRSNER